MSVNINTDSVCVWKFRGVIMCCTSSSKKLLRLQSWRHSHMCCIKVFFPLLCLKLRARKHYIEIERERERERVRQREREREKEREREREVYVKV